MATRWEHDLSTSCSPSLSVSELPSLRWWGRTGGARQYDRARQIAWTRAGTIAVVCGMLGLVVAVQPSLWLALFSNSTEVARIGALYLRIVGPVYVCFGLGFGLFFVSQGYGRGFAAMSTNAGTPNRECRRGTSGGVCAWTWHREACSQPWPEALFCMPRFSSMRLFASNPTVPTAAELRPSERTI